MSFEEVIRIPEERVSKVLRARKELEAHGVMLRVENNEVIVRGEGFELLKSKNVITAIGRGFRPSDALLLMNDDYSLEIIDVNDYARTKNSRVRLKGRVIGDEGRAKRFIESRTGCVLSIQGKTVSIIGKNDEVIRARRAVIMLLGGAKHGTAYHFLEKRI